MSMRWTNTPCLTHDDALIMSGITSRKCTMADLNGLEAEEFIRKVGGIFEHSPWIAEAVAGQRPFATSSALLDAMVQVVDASGEARQLALIRAHPDLAGRLAQQGKLTAESSREQAAAGLDSAAAETVSRIGELNTAYRARFEFPFIICARLNNVNTILEAMEVRLGNEPVTEQATALGEIGKIARLRLADIVED
jgi:2-oxo-4-hydroxy-4-carboxy-5-ureidoimidazoline decarboxylase